MMMTHRNRSIALGINMGNKSRIVYTDCNYGPIKEKNLSVLPVEDENQTYCFAILINLFYLNICHTALRGGKNTFVQYFYVTRPIGEVDNPLNCVCLKSATKNEMDHSVDLSQFFGNSVQILEWRGISPFYILRSVHHND